MIKMYTYVRWRLKSSSFIYMCVYVIMYGAGRLLINAAMSMSHDTKVHYLDLAVAHGI